MQQILIITESSDNTADKVCYWLNYYKQGFVRFNTDLEGVWVHEVELKQDTVSILLGHQSGIYDLKDFGIIWFRRGQFINSIKGVKNALYPDDPVINNQVNNHLQREIDELNNFVYAHIPIRTKTINNPVKYNINKLSCLYEAARIGLKIPYTLVTRTLAKVKRVMENTALITKNIGDILICHNDYFFCMQGTVFVDNNEFENEVAFFQPSLFQEAIRKIADIRVFFLFDEVFPTAIINQDESLFDFRSSRTKAICRYELPETIKRQLLLLAEKMGLESGSADFVLSEYGELFFLEINPVGQVDFVSHLANLYIEKNIAKQLINYATASIKETAVYK